MKKLFSLLLITSFGFVDSLVATTYDQYKLNHARKKQQSIKLYAQENRTEKDQQILNKLSHEWANREMAAYNLNRLHSAESFADYKRRLTEYKIRATELAAKTNRTASEQAELNRLGHAWALREHAVYNQINALRAMAPKKMGRTKHGGSPVKKKINKIIKN